jgi:tetratricopeptide (TPR) repeat protein
VRQIPFRAGHAGGPVFGPLVLAAMLGLAGGSVVPAIFAATALAQKATAREQVGKPVEAAELLLKQKKYKDALAKLHQADAVAGKTPYEVYLIAATRAAIDLEAGDDSGAIEALEAALATGILPPADALKRVETLGQLNYQAKNYAKAAEYGGRYYSGGGKDPQPRILMAQAYFLMGDAANAAKTSLEAVRADEVAGRPPSEPTLQMLAAAQYKLGDAAGYAGTLTRLVAIDPKKEYWAGVLTAIQKAPGFSGRFALDIARLSAAADTLEKPDQYMAAAELALQMAQSGTAKSLLDKGYAAGVLGTGPAAPRQQRLAAMASRQVEDDVKTLPQLAKDAEAAPDGPASVKLGEAYASFDRYGEAIAAFQKALQKGGLKYPDDAKLHLGLAYLKAGDPAKAKLTLNSVTGADGAQALARLWLIEAGIK